tara:strand:- start:11391 stop:13319 length:1929 start_codon:yes stop_codon:yes gene_type:complete
MVNCTDFQCPRDSYFKKQNIGENAFCNENTDGECEKKCCNEYTICGEWSFHDNECRNGKYPNPSRTIPSEIYGDNPSNLSVENVCCDNVKCSDYTCPEGYKDQSGVEEKVIYDDSGFYKPNEQCCDPKNCSDWKDDGNSCYPFDEFSGVNRPGYSENACCYKLCSSWKEHRKKDLDEPMKQRLNYMSISELEERAIYENIPNEEIDNARNSNINDPTTIKDELINLIINKISSTTVCEGGTLIEGKPGWGEDECCIDKINTCFHKSWECPEGYKMNINNLDKSCHDSIRGCNESAKNIDLCCQKHNICSTFTCPKNYHLNPRNMNESCLKRTCSTLNDLETCCLENEKCSDLICGRGYHHTVNNKDNYCMGAKCTLKNDRDFCCSENDTCKSMECPDGYYINEKSKDKKCYDETCDIDNRFNLLRCCYECKGVDHALDVVCTTHDDSIATSCERAYVLSEGICKGHTADINVLLKIDAEYDSFILIENYSTKLKNDLCEIIHTQKNIPKEKCNEIIIINEIKKGSVVAFLTIINEINTDNSLNKNDIQTLFKKGTLLKTLNFKINETPQFQEEDKGDIKCADGTFEYQCPFYMSVRKDARSIHGSTNVECCELEWDILRYIIPLLLCIILLIYSFIKYKLGK